MRTIAPLAIDTTTSERSQETSINLKRLWADSPPHMCFLWASDAHGLGIAAALTPEDLQ